MYSQFTSSLRMVGRKNYHIIKKRNKLTRVVFIFYLNLPFPEVIGGIMLKGK